MFYLKGKKKNGDIVRLVVHGQTASGKHVITVNSYIGEVNTSTDGKMRLTQRVGYVKARNGELYFDFTKEFKLEIDYNEHTGSSTLDACSWLIKDVKNGIYPTDPENQTLFYLNSNAPCHNIGLYACSLFEFTDEDAAEIENMTHVPSISAGMSNK